MNRELTKTQQYASKIVAQLAELFNEECENYIDINELGEGNNATDFIHALANIAPNMMAYKLIGEKRNLLEFNHMANQLCFQYAKLTKE